MNTINDSEKIRRANAKDIPRVLELLTQVCNVHNKGRPDIFKANATKYNENELKKIFLDEKSPVFVFEKNQNVVGYIFCELQETKNNNVLFDCKTLYIDDLCVDESERKSGIGKRLYENAVEYARSLGCNRVTLNVWELNPTAKRFYENLGMKTLKTYMEKPL